MRQLAGLLLISVFSQAAVYSQTFYTEDLLRYAQYDPMGTARGLGSGGAFGTVGADLSSIYSNPAGLGLYRSSEAVFSPGLLSTSTKADFLETTSKGNRTRLHVSTAGVVFARPRTDVNRAFKGYSFALSVERANNFNNELNFFGTNAMNSITWSFAEQANGLPPSQINYNNTAATSVLALQTNLISQLDSSNFYQSVTLLPTEQQGTWKTKGGTDIMHVAVGANISHKLYIGGSLNFHFLDYQSEYIFEERDEAGATQNFESLSLEQTYRALGYGFSASGGIIYRPVTWLKVGAGIHSKTQMTISEEFGTSMTSIFSGVRYDDQAPDGAFDFNASMPLRVTAGASVLIARRAFVSVDYEFLDYGSSTIDFGPGNEDFNDLVDEQVTLSYTKAHAIRIGGEIVAKEMRFRLGGGFNTQPWNKDFILPGDAGFSSWYFSAGLGYRHKKYSIDLAYVHSQKEEFFFPYILSGFTQPPAVFDIRKDNVVLGAAWRFGK